MGQNTSKMGRRSFTDRHILITGASSGIGAALAKELAPHQPHLLLVARRKNQLEELADELQKLGAASVQTFVADVSDRNSLEAVSLHIRQTWKSLDLLVNNAVISAHGRFENHTEQMFRQIMEVNFFSAVELTRLAIPLLRSGHEPMVVNMSSILGHRGIPFNSEYCASKFALRGWSESIRPELRREGIALLLVSPGTTDTEFFEHLISKQGQLPWGKSKAISPEQAARQIVRGIERGRREIFPNWRGRLFVLFNRFCPGLVDRLMQRYG